MNVINKNKGQGKIDIQRIYNAYGIWFILILMGAVLTILTSDFLTVNNLLNLLRQISFISIIGFGSAFILIAGGLDLSPGSVVALTSVVATTYGHGEYPVIIPILVAMGIGLLCGSINGVLITVARVPAFIATLGMMQSAKGLAMLVSGGASVVNLSKDLKFIGQGDLFGIPVPIVFMLIIAVLMYVILNHTPYGRRIVGTGNNELAAKISGINTKAITISVYAIGGLLAGITSILMSARISAGQPTLGTGYEMDAISAAVIGGVSLKGGIGTVFGVVCGALIIGIINNGMDLLGVSSYYQQIVKGVIIVLAIILDQFKNRKQ